MLVIVVVLGVYGGSHMMGVISGYIIIINNVGCLLWESNDGSKRCVISGHYYY